MEASACEGRTAQIRALPCSLEGQTSGTKEEEKQKTEQKKAGGPRLNVWNARRCADLEAFQQEPLKQLVLFALQEPARKASPPFRAAPVHPAAQEQEGPKSFTAALFASLKSPRSLKALKSLGGLATEDLQGRKRKLRSRH